MPSPLELAHVRVQCAQFAQGGGGEGVVATVDLGEGVGEGGGRRRGGRKRGGMRGGRRGRGGRG